MTAPGKPDGGWWDDLISAPGDFVRWLDSHQVPNIVSNENYRNTALDFPKAVRGEIARFKQDPQQFLTDMIGPGNLVGGVTTRSARPAIKKLLAEFAKEGGATLEQTGERFAGSGYAVADPELTTIVSSPKEAKAFLKRRDVRNALSAGRRLGKWTDPETGKTEINITDIIDDLKAAQKAAAQRAEQAVGHLQDGEYMGDVRNPHAPVNAVKELLAQMRQNPQMRRITEIPSTRGKQLAEAYENLPKNDPAAKEAYDALNAEVANQLKRIKDAGYTIEYVKEDPYKNSAEMMADVRENKRLKVFSADDSHHPYMSGDQTNAFRAVHDFLAHAGGGNQFSAVGEENAYRVHASTLSRLAQRALASETRGQNSWVNFGPHGHLPVKERPFAEQKAALFPENLLDDYEVMGQVISGPNGPERVASATITDPVSGKVYTGKSHQLAVDEAVRQGVDEDTAMGWWENHSGFRTSTGRDISREEAGQLAKAQSQIRPENLWEASEFGDNTGLASEWLQEQKAGAPAVHTRPEWQPTERGVFDRGPEGGVPSAEYREPADLPFQTEVRMEGRGKNKTPAEPTDLAQQIATDPRVERRIISDLEKGLGLGGRGWFGLLPIRRYFEARGGPISFADFNQAGAAGSARTPTHNELTNISLMLYAKKHGISYEAARQEFFRRFPGTMKPTFMGMHGSLFDRAQRLGYAAPVKPSAGALKIPHYYHDRMLKGKGVALDTHEMRAMAQALGVPEEVIKMAMKDAKSYEMMMAPYLRVAERYGLHPDQVQASRWIGGGPETGLKSQPMGDFVQTVEDGLLYTAQQQGRDESPRGLRSLWDAIAGGDDFFLPYRGEGGFPVNR